jgi:hypothetical protein
MLKEFFEVNFVVFQFLSTNILEILTQLSIKYFFITTASLNQVSHNHPLTIILSIFLFFNNSIDLSSLAFNLSETFQFCLTILQ